MNSAPAPELPAYAQRIPELESEGFGAVFIGRVPRIDVQVDRELALARLQDSHVDVRRQLGLAGRHFCTVAQVHGNEVISVSRDMLPATPPPQADAMTTDDPQCVLGIYVADCCAVSVVDPVHRAIGLAHSGRKGSDQNITGAVIQQMGELYGSKPGDLLVHLSPCIRLPHYEVDFAASIRRDAAAAGVQQICDDGACTASAPEQYYSYRRELGKTGRMLALLWL